MGKTAAILVPLLLAATAAASLVAWQEHQQLEAQSPTLRKAAIISSENDALRDALEAAQRQAADLENRSRREKIEADVSAIRELPFKKPVVYAVLDRAGIRQVVADKLSQAYTDQEMQDMSTGYSALGLLPPNFPLKQTFINLLGEQIAAFYDQHQHKLFMFRDASLENAQNRVILAHELTHALQDQNFGLLKLPLEAKNNDDQAAAASALIEGDATLVMSQYMAQDLSWRTFADTVTYSATRSMEQIRKAPHYLREMLVFPYIQGQKFCAAVFARGGYPALSAVYANPPASTAQILHPDKYFAESREDPVPVNFADTSFKGEKPLADNVLGEMGLRLLFAQFRDAAASTPGQTSESIAAGWRGDRYLVFDHGKELVWVSVWRSAEAAGLADQAIRSMITSRYRGAMDGSSGNGEGDGRAFSIVLDKNEVVLVVAPDIQSRGQLTAKFTGASHG